MATESCPPVKRQKLADTIFQLRTILPNEFVQELPLVKVYISVVEEKRKISSVMQELCKLLPLADLQHLKRVRQHQVLLCKVADIGERDMEVYLKDMKFSTETIKCLCEQVQQHAVPATPAKLRWQYELACKHWPCKFHPDKYLESLYDGSIFNIIEKNFHATMIKLLQKISIELENGRPCGLCVDARNGSIVALAASHVTVHPMMHCPMVLVDFVARTQHGGAWNDKYGEDFVQKTDKANVTLVGIPKRYFEFVSNDEEYSKKCKFGAESVRSDIRKPVEMEALSADNSSTDNLTKYGPYLCTGYNVYLTNEPCLMCAMALVHSRVKRIFYAQRSENGAVMSRLKLHAVKELNHHYEVFECTDKQQDSPICTQR